MNKKLKVTFSLAFCSLALAACTAVNVQGEVVDKYWDSSDDEYMVVIDRDPGTGVDKVAVMVDDDDYRTITVGQQFDSAKYDTQTDD